MTNLGFFLTSGSRTHVRFQFATFAAAGANVAPSSALEAADLRIYKAADGAAFSATQRSSANGITVTSPFDSLTGYHDVDIDLTDNTDASFYAAGSAYIVVLAPDETVDSQTLTGVPLAYFEIGVPTANVTQWLGAAAATPTVAGVPEVDLTHVAGATTNVAALATNVDAILTDTAEIGAAGAGLTNINLPNQTMDIVGNITGNLSGSVGSVTGAVGSVTGNVGGNVVGSVASVVGAVGSVTGAVGSVTGAVGSVTGNVGGNVVGSVASVTGNVGGNVVGSVASVTAKVTPIDVDGITFANWAKYVGATTQGKVVITLISGDDYTYDAYSVDGLSIVWTTTVNLGNRAQPTRS